MTIISTETEAYVSNETGGGEMAVILAYDTSDPAVVEFTFQSPFGDQVWDIGRELLYGAFARPNNWLGLMDVQTSLVDLTDRLYIRLSGPSDAVTVVVDATVMEEFLKATDNLVARNEERYDWDSVVEKILEEA